MEESLSELGLRARRIDVAGLAQSYEVIPT